MSVCVHECVCVCVCVCVYVHACFLSVCARVFSIHKHVTTRDEHNFIN